MKGRGRDWRYRDSVMCCVPVTRAEGKDGPGGCQEGVGASGERRERSRGFERDRVLPLSPPRRLKRRLIQSRRG